MAHKVGHDVKRTWHRKKLWILGILAAAVGLGGVFLTIPVEGPPDNSTVYYTELTCKPEEDRFEMHPKSITRAELKGKNDAQSEVLKKQGYAVFLNGGVVGEKVFKHVCALKNEVKVEVDVDYGREKGIALKKDFPELFETFSRGKNTFPTIIYRLRGEVDIRQKGKVIASVSNTLIENNPNNEKAFSIYVIGNKLKLPYYDPDEAIIKNRELSVKELQSKPFSWKKISVIIN